MVGSQAIDYVITRRERKTLEIAVEPDASVSVAAPLDASIDAIEIRLRRRAAWIMRQQRYFSQFLPRTPERLFISGETHLYLGRQYRLKVVPHVQAGVKLTRGFIVVQTHRPNSSEVTRELVDAWYRERQRDKLESWVSKAVLKLGPTDGTMDVLYAGTVLHFDAVIVRFSRRPGWIVSRYQAILKWPDRMDLWDRWEELYLNDEASAELFWARNQEDMTRGAVLNWPEMHSLIFLMQERAGDHDAFESEYQNNPISASNAFRDLTYWVMRRPDWLFFGAIDPSLGKAGAGRDPSAILIGGYSRDDGVLDVVEASIRKRLPDVIIDDAIALQREYQCQLWFVETVQFQELLRTELMKRAAKIGLAMPCVPITPIADKMLRIERLQPPIRQGLIRLGAAQRTLIDQLQQWPTAAHDDGPDCLEMLYTNTLEKAGAMVPGGGLRSRPNALNSFMEGF